MPEENTATAATTDATTTAPAVKEKTIGISDVWKVVGGFSVVDVKDRKKPPHPENNPVARRKGKQSDIISWRVDGNDVTVVTIDGQKIQAQLRR